MHSLEEQIVNIENEALSDEQAFAKMTFEELEDKKTKVLSYLPNKQVTSYEWTTVYDDSHADLQNKKRENDKYYYEIEKCEHYLESNKLYIGHLSKEDKEIIFTENTYDYIQCDIFNSDEHNIWIINVDSKDYKEFYDQWKTPQKYIDNEIRFSRNVDIDNKEVRNVVTIIDNINKNNKLYSTIFDNYLRESLIRNKNKKGIYSIIQTIQAKQDEIRFLEAQTNFAVQGCAGSGKTLILLHRIRQLLYANLINSRNYILLVPSNKFKNYIKKDSLKNFRISSDNIIPIQEYFMASCNIKSNADQDTNELHLPREFLAHIYSKEFIQECYYEFFNKISEKADKFFSFIYKSETGNHAIIENAIEQINGIAGYALKKGSIQLNTYTDIKKLIDYIDDEKAKYKAFYEMSNDIVIDDTVLIYDEISFDKVDAVLMEVYDIYHTVNQN